MKPLQIGDECYVRIQITGEIIHCRYVKPNAFRKDAIHWAHQAKSINKINGIEYIEIAIGKGSPNRLVYPFQCVKELAR